MNSKFKSGLKKDEDRVSSLRNKKQKVYERQIKASEQAVIDLSELKTEIMRRKNQLLQDIGKLKAYTDFLTLLI